MSVQTMSNNTSRYLGITSGVLSLLATTGCTQVPSIALFGAYFPDWLFCIVGGIVAAAILRTLMPNILGSEEFGSGALLCYLALVTIGAVLGWLVFFGG